MSMMQIYVQDGRRLPAEGTAHQLSAFAVTDQAALATALAVCEAL